MRSRPWPPAVQPPLADIAVIGGSGFYSMGGDIEMHPVDTPYGPPSGDVAITEVGGRRVAFVPRHGVDHTIPAHRVNYRANLWALHSLGVRALIAPCSVGSLTADIAPGHMVVLDDIIDRTHGRADTYFDGDDGVVNHVTFARPYDESLRGLAVAACSAQGVIAHASGTVVVINGPRFSSRAESRWFGSLGAAVVNMTQYPEAALAAELALPYCGIALVTDYDAGIEGVEERPVTMEQVLGVMRDNVGSFQRVLQTMIAAWTPAADS
jgi:5'-methylthioadenosine phosphorylase